MGAAGRRADLLARLRRLEGEFERQLISDLVQCASGVWGLFRQNEPLEGPWKHRFTLGDELDKIGEEIRALQGQLGEPGGFSPLERLESYRGLRGPNVPGEPRLAKQLLAELGYPRE